MKQNKFKIKKMEVVEISLKDLFEKDKKSIIFDIILNKTIKSVMDKQQEERPKNTFHCSNIIVEPENFCIRRQVFDYYLKKPQELQMNIRKIFYAGIKIHEKIQEIFKIANIAEKIEVTHYSRKYHLTGTPDAIIKLCGKNYVVEIKSVRSEIFKRMKLTTKPLSSAIVQANLYMMLTATPRAIILTENKNDHENKYFFIEFEPELILKYLEQHLKVLEAMKQRKLPKPICKNQFDKRFKNCPYNMQHCFKDI